MDAPTSPKSYARREAQPIPWDHLSEDQKAAIQQAARILEDLANAKTAGDEDKSAKESHLDLFLPAIDAERLNHVILLDGDRGSGKTAVLVTLLDAWSRMLRDRDQKLDKDFLATLKGTDHVVPIGLIDLQPLPKSTNLLLYLVGRFQRVVEAIEQVHNERGSASRKSAGRREERHPWQGVSPEEPGCTQKWRDFVHAAALGWNGDLERRRGSLDPEAFVLELEQTERRRLDTVSSFRKLIDALVEDYPRLGAKPKENPLFLLAVDDADTNPDKAEELLDLVRTLWHPRVAFLLTGDSNLFLAMLRNRMAKSLGVSKDSEVVSFANNLAIDIYNKAIPPAHRCAFPRLPPRMRFDRMQAHLQQLTCPTGALADRFSTLFDVLQSNDQLQEALPSRERALADLKVRINTEIAATTQRKAKGATGIDDEATRHVIAALCRAAFAPSMPSEKAPDYGPEEDLLHAARNARNWDLRVSEKNALLLPNDTDWNLVAQRSPRWETKHGGLITESMIAAGMLARDVVEHSLRYRETTPALKPMGLLGAVVRAEYTVEAIVYSFAWPLPDWPSFADYFYFGKRWAAYVPDPEKFNRNDVDALACRYIHAIVIMLQGGKQEPTAQWAWQSLANYVNVLASSKDSTAAHWAVSRAGLMAAPESGLSHEAANQWLNALKEVFGTKWEEVRLALRKERRVRVWSQREPAPEKLPDFILSTIDKRYPEYKWHEVIEHDPVQPIAQPTKDKVTLQPVLDVLKTIPTTWWPGRSNLAAYFDLKSRKAMFNAETSQERLNELLKAVEPYKGNENRAAEAIVKLWQVECRLLGVSTEDIEVKDGQIIAPSLATASILECEPTRLWESQHQNGAAFYLLDWRIGKGSSIPNEKGKEKTDLRGVLLRGIFDMMVDAADVENAASPPPPCRAPYWPGFGGYTLANKPGYQWPVPGWPTCYDWERLADAWNATIMRIKNLHGVNLRELEQYQPVIHAFTSWLLLSIPAIFRGEKLLAPVDLNPDFYSSVNNGIEAVAQRPTSPTTSRAKAYGAWCDNLLLFAAPESGISRNLAMELLAQPQIAGNLEDKKASLRNIRVERARTSGVPDAEVDRELASIDGANRDHPWVHTFGPHTAP